MKIEVIKNIKEFKSLQIEWDLLFSKGDYSLFQSFNFNYYSWKYVIKGNRNQLAITVVRTNNNLVGIFPFYVDGKNRLRFINDLHFDFCDILTISSLELSIILAYLKKNLSFKSIRLINIKQESNIYKQGILLNTKNKIVSSNLEYSTLHVEKGLFPYNVPHFRSHQKHRINKASRKHKQKEYKIFTHEKYKYPEEDIITLKEKMISLGLRKDNFFSNDMLLLTQDLYYKGKIIIGIIKEDNQVNGINFIIKESSGRFIFWIDLFDTTQMINIANYIFFIKNISFNHSVTLNFGRGRYFYKVSNFAPIFHQLYGLFIFSNVFQKIRFIIFESFKTYVKLYYRKLKK